MDTQTRRQKGPDHVPERVYRLIGAPGGSTLYWDQPMIMVACTMAVLTDQPRYAEAVARYLDAFLARCVAPNGMFLWGNHAYYDTGDKTLVAFSNGYHELRPITPAWDIWWTHDAERTEAHIRTMAQRHVYDVATGGFNRHDDGQKGHAFIEAGGILSESVAWLAAQTGDEQLLATALRIAHYSYDHRHPVTGLVPNEPDMGRWDAHVCTSEIGLWACCLLRAEANTGCREFGDLAAGAVRAWLEYAFDPASGRYWGQVSIADGQPVMPTQIGYWPRRYADPWNTDQWPTHDYPMAVAEACLTLYERTADEAFLAGVQRWAALAMTTRPSQTGGWAYAESYGRCIHFLTRAGRLLGDEQFLADARALADEAVSCLWQNGMFQGRPASHVYESVAGVGFLLLALLYVEEPCAIRRSGFPF